MMGILAALVVLVGVIVVWERSADDSVFEDDDK
jgi:hypothetical protein